MDAVQAAQITLAFFAPHPDDDALAAGATLAKLADLGARVHVWAATRGQLGIPGTSVEAAGERRVDELAAACARLGATCHGSFGFMDGSLRDTNRLRRKIVAATQEVGANMVMTTAPWCYHPDHRKLGRAVRNCQQRYTTQPSPRIVYCDQFIKGIGVGTRRPDLCLDATEYWGVKQAAFACYESQGEETGLARYMEVHGRERGIQRDPEVEYAECFYGSGILGHDAGLRWLTRALDDD